MITDPSTCAGRTRAITANVLRRRTPAGASSSSGSPRPIVTEMRAGCASTSASDTPSGDDDAPALSRRGRAGATGSPVTRPIARTRHSASTPTIAGRPDPLQEHPLSGPGAYYFRPGVALGLRPRQERPARRPRRRGHLEPRLRVPPGSRQLRDLGIELNAQLYFQSKDGTLNDDPDKMGGFYTAVQYGVLFPLGGLGQLRGEDAVQKIDPETAQTVRWYLGILF